MEDLFYAQLTFDVVSSLLEELRDRLAVLSAVRSWASTLLSAARIENEEQEWKVKAEDYWAAFQAAKQVIEDMRRFSEAMFMECRMLLDEQSPPQARHETPCPRMAYMYTG